MLWAGIILGTTRLGVCQKGLAVKEKAPKEAVMPPSGEQRPTVLWRRSGHLPGGSDGQTELEHRWGLARFREQGRRVF